MTCSKCGRSDPDVQFSRLKHREKRCDDCYRSYQSNHYLTRRKVARREKPEKHLASCRKYHSSHKEEKRAYVLSNLDKFQDSWRTSHRKRYETLRDFVAACKSVPCHDCGFSFPSCCMDFDHRDPTKKVASISRMIGHSSFSELFSEIGKCDIICSNCHRLRTNASQSNKYSGRKAVNRDYIDSLKKGPCFDCKGSFHPRQMDFDHLHGKQMNISSMILYSKVRIDLEVAKCDLVCSCCHRIRTVSRLVGKAA